MGRPHARQFLIFTPNKGYSMLVPRFVAVLAWWQRAGALGAAGARPFARIQGRM